MFHAAAVLAVLATLCLGKAYAVEWITEGSVADGDLTAIKIIDWRYLSFTYDVEFVFDTAANVYGETPVFPIPTKTDADAAIRQISRTLTSGPSSSDPNDSATAVSKVWISLRENTISKEPTRASDAREEHRWQPLLRERKSIIRKIWMGV